MVKSKYSTFHLTGKKAFFFKILFYSLFYVQNKEKWDSLPRNSCKANVAGQDKYMNNTNDLISKDKESLTLKW